MKLIDDFSSSKSTYEPYKYIMQDTGSLYIGAKLTYSELIAHEQCGFKLKAIITQYVLKATDISNSLESEFYYLTGDSFVYETFEQLKARVRVRIPVQKKNIFGKVSTVYTEKTYTIKELVNINLAKKKGMGLVITEVILSKLALMSFVV